MQKDFFHRLRSIKTTLDRHDFSKAVSFKTLVFNVFETSCVYIAVYVILRQWEKFFYLVVKCYKKYFYLFLSLTEG
jgi:hypothetical protein